jgi:aminopeptidase N
MALRITLALAASLVLTLTPARAQDALDALHYTATIGFDLSNRTISADASVTVRNAGATAMDSVRLHLRDLTATTVRVGIDTTQFIPLNGELSVLLPTPLPAGDTTTITVSYHGRATSEAGPSSWGGCFWGPTTFAMGVGFYAPYVSCTRHWLPSNDVPSDKATFDLTFVVPEGSLVAGTGLLASAITQGGRTSFRWIENHPTATYLATYAISQYARVLETHNGLPYEYYVARADSNRARTYFSTVPGMVAAFEKAFGAYPFDKVGYCLTPIGSMEHQTMISYAASLFQDQYAGGIAAHELAHQWWGDCVTPADFREAWLSEGFATYSEAIYREALAGTDGYLQRARQFVQSYFNDERYEGTFALYDFPRAQPSSNYPGTIYSKGAAVLAMLRHIIGDSAFFRGLLAYRAAHAYGNATTPDLRGAFEQTSGQSLGWFFDEWVYLRGYPRYTVSSVVPRTGSAFRLVIEQNTSDTARYPLYEMPLDVWIVTASGDTLRRVVTSHALPKESFVFQDVADTAVVRWLIDPLGIVLKTLRTSVVDVDAPAQSQDSGLRLEGNYPNPARIGHGAGTTVPFSIDTPSGIRAVMHDTLGRLVRTLADGTYPAGWHFLSIPVDGLRPGTYLVRISAGDVSRHITVSVER